MKQVCKNSILHVTKSTRVYKAQIIFQQKKVNISKSNKIGKKHDLLC